MVDAVQRRREVAVGLAIGLDLLILGPYIVIGIATPSWPIIAESLRGGLLLVVAIVSLITLRRIHRDRLGDYDYGAGKLEQAITLSIAALLLIAAGLLLWRVALLAPTPPASPLLATSAVVLVFVNLVLNGAQLWSLHRASRDGGSIIVRAQYQARWVKTIASAFVVVAVTLAMVAGDPQLSRRASQIGTLIVIVIMVGTAVAMLREALPDLLDRSLPEAVQQAVNRVLARNIDDFEQLGRVRTRSAGNVLHVELELFLDPARTVGEASLLAERMSRQLAEEIPGVDAVIVPRALPG